MLAFGSLALLFVFCRLRSRPEIHEASSSLATRGVGLIDLWAPRIANRLWILARLASRFKKHAAGKSSSTRKAECVKTRLALTKPRRTEDMGTKPTCPRWRTIVRSSNATSFPTRPLENRISPRPSAWRGPLHRMDSCRSVVKTFRVGMAVASSRKAFTVVAYSMFGHMWLTFLLFGATFAQKSVLRSLLEQAGLAK